MLSTSDRSQLLKGEQSTMKNLTWIMLCLVSLLAISHENANAKIDPGSIVGIWLLDEGQGDTVKDSSENGNDGKIVKAKWVDGKIGKGLEFDGTGHVEIPASKTTDDYRNGFTYLLWVKPTEAPPNVNTRVIERDWHNPTIQIGPTDFYGSIAVNADQAATHVRGGAWKRDEWSFVAITYDGDVIQLYVDGEFVADKAVGKADDKPHAATPAPHQGSIWFATWKNPGWDFRGVLDDVGVFNTPLTDDELKDIMDNGLEEASAVSPLRKLTSTWGRIKRMR